MQNPTLTDRIAALGVIVLTALAAMDLWHLIDTKPVTRPLLILVVGLYVLRVRTSRRAFVLVGIGLTLWLWIERNDWRDVVRNALDKGIFIAAFFTALATLRNVAETSPALRRAGNFLAAQPPGRRYAALTGGGHAFALLLNYGSMSLLGSLATQASRDEPNAEIRGHRTRRMLLAIQRGFLSSLPWSPLGFALAVTTALIPGASWAGAVVPGLVTSALMMGCGWAMDSVFKPRLTQPPAPRGPVTGNWSLILPLFGLLLILAVSVGGLHIVTGLRVVSIVIVVVPAISLIWALIQARREMSLPDRLSRFARHDVPGYREEISLLIMAGFIGTAGAPLLQPIVAALGIDLATWPVWVVLPLFVWLVPLLGQLGMNPILAVTLLAPLIPDAASLGVPPSAIVAAIAAGWALSGATSPFTATTLLIGALGGVNATHVGLRWNGAYFLVCAAILTVWVVAYGLLAGG